MMIDRQTIFLKEPLGRFYFEVYNFCTVSLIHTPKWLFTGDLRSIGQWSGFSKLIEVTHLFNY